MEENEDKKLEMDVSNLEKLVSFLKEGNEEIIKRIEEKEKYLEDLLEN